MAVKRLFNTMYAQIFGQFPLLSECLIAHITEILVLLLKANMSVL
jgi:hypothetical protein